MSQGWDAPETEGEDPAPDTAPRPSLPPEISSDEVAPDEIDALLNLTDEERRETEADTDDGELVREDEIIPDSQVANDLPVLDSPPTSTLDLPDEIRNSRPGVESEEHSMSSTNDLIRKSLIDPVERRLGFTLPVPSTGISVELAGDTASVLLKKQWIDDEEKMLRVISLVLPVLDADTYTDELINETDFATLAGAFIAELAQVPKKTQPQRHILSSALDAAFKKRNVSA